jgi:hypothetical protein
VVLTSIQVFTLLLHDTASPGQPGAHGSDRHRWRTLGKKLPRMRTDGLSSCFIGPSSVKLLNDYTVLSLVIIPHYPFPFILSVFISSDRHQHLLVLIKKNNSTYPSNHRTFSCLWRNNSKVKTKGRWEREDKKRKGRKEEAKKYPLYWGCRKAAMNIRSYLKNK